MTHSPPARWRRWPALLALLLLFAAAPPARGQFDETPEEAAEASSGIRLDEARTVRLKVGIIIRSTGGPLRGVYGTTPIPIEWPEQRVKIVDEEASRHVKRVRFRTLGKTMKQMEVTIPFVEKGGTAEAFVTLEVERHAILAPEQTDGFTIPAKVDRSLKPFLLASPFIETRNVKIRKVAEELAAGWSDETDWQKVESIYDWVREHVTYQDGPLKGAYQALKDGTGDCEELSSLFIALCRINDIPARTVWIPGHCYPEFYLEDAKGNGHWFPCQAAGDRAFGSMPEHRVILQKGDNFKVPHHKKRQRYVSEFLRVDAPGQHPPRVEFVRDVLPE
ncbi:MAG: transglutaminase domain-containing protein [Planctomycetota bacterium]|nr:MAG: transglutaminase domain-containing protein [Planctomycetota bacterium]REJ94095.1 MAG: transglutaminase domain-containing protein [Planctomycetota bacterium]REK26281.1 MAG: transglutaminase domain-containing protein [Planctomycetota bacterium]REK45832.1 MAG: transglutaminase domain-containing protein [Planctomycetota bacterium]